MGTSMMRSAAVLAVLAVACTSPGTPRVAPSGGVPAFDGSALIDVLPPDAIPAIDDPRFESARAAASWLEPVSPVVAFDHRGDARAYPLAILMFHEIVNDEVGGDPVAVTYCPLCGSAVAYRRTVGARALTFGVSGKLYRSDLVMFDRETTSLWPQMEGRAVRGELRGTELDPLPASILSFEDFRARYPDGTVLRRPGGEGVAARSYGVNPYVGYDGGDGPRESFFAGTLDDRLDAMERVVGVAIGDEARAYAYRSLAEVRVVHGDVGGSAIVVLWGGDAVSALDERAIDDGRRVGAAGVFDPTIDGRTLRFRAEGDAFVDRQTGSRWLHTGIAVDGPLAGTALRAVRSIDAFWFAWAAFVPHTDIWVPPAR